MQSERIINAENTTKRPLPEGQDSWLDYWVDRKSFQPNNCMILGCGRKAEVGGQVHIVVARPLMKPPLCTWNRNLIFIIPMCRECSHYKNRRIMKVLKKDLIPDKDIRLCT